MFVKYPSTSYLPYSPSIARGDKILEDLSKLKSEEIVVTEKMDGENISIYKDRWHCRSLDSKPKAYHSYLQSVILPSLQFMIPDGFRVCGEYLYAKHSISYHDLIDYFQVFSVWDNDRCLSWDDTKRFTEEHCLHHVREIYMGKYDKEKIIQLGNETIKNGGEGIVIRVAGEFLYRDFSIRLAKYVRPNHVQEGPHWSLAEITKNELRG